ncbi:hypothetical protein OCV51_10295 [Faecalicatena acetigenes]|uniref:DUF1492 domain-containing protein n=1 Tax=Faecalicatena acetigenes TaxID=2981790 RepID=A0ABT2TCM5_9FIRM|nr:hypothetical protein [Faecalicatena acetigenes]MCU6748035.1 hypothetical protein [Faecalicatena acetigenes]SCI22656.1 Uncharacterised protein [uncultured Clostridium sp.]
MDTKTYLQQIERLDRKIQNKFSEIAQLKTMATSITVAQKDVNVQTSSDKDRMGSAVAKIVDLEIETNEMICEYIQKRGMIIQQIDAISDTNMYHILFNRYVMMKDLGTIAVEIGYSFKQVCRIHGNALKEFEKMYGEVYLKCA